MVAAKEINVDGVAYVLKAPAKPKAHGLKRGDFVQVTSAMRKCASGPYACQMGQVVHASPLKVDVQFGTVYWSFSAGGDTVLTINPAISLLTKLS